MGKLTFKVKVEGDRFAGTMTTSGRETGAQVKSLIGSMLKEFSIDQNRIYITGQSGGGTGTWTMIAAYPDFFAAAVPVCGWGDVSRASLIVKNNVAVWAFHGALDPAIPADASRNMIATLRKAGGKPRYTEYPDVKHNSWVSAYPDPRLHVWLFQQQRSP
jgi:predicted peptidase